MINRMDKDSGGFTRSSIFKNIDLTDELKNPYVVIYKKYNSKIKHFLSLSSHITIENEYAYNHLSYNSFYKK